MHEAQAITGTRREPLLAELQLPASARAVAFDFETCELLGNSPSGAQSGPCRVFVSVWRMGGR